jgi:RNA polymerase sigma factor (sigma-70 family)
MERMRGIVHPKDFDRYVYFCSVVYQTVLERPWDSLSHFSMNIHINVRSTYLCTHVRVIPYIREHSPETLLFILSPSTGRDLQELILHEKRGRAYRRYDTAAERWGRNEKLSALTRREREVVMHAKNGLTYKEIALMLKCSERTVRNLTTRLYRKLDARSMIESLRVVDNYNLMCE